jgi:Domain of unknown function (DUF4349)
MDALETTAVIDRTLAGESAHAGNPLERELRELTLALAAEAPEPAAGFARELDERVVRGFPRDRHAARLTLAWARATAVLRKRPPLALAGAVASLLIALVVAVPLLNSDDALQRAELPAAPPAQDQGSGATELDSLAGGSIAAQPPAAAERRAEALKAGLATEPTVADRDVASAGDSAALPLIAPAPPVDRSGFAPGARDRRIERSATLTLAAPDDRLDRVAADIATVTDRHRGFVLSSSLATGDEGATTGGQFELRIPAARLDAALADLARLGQVRSRTTAGQDVTAAFVTAGDRLEAARAERASLLTRLESADTDNEATALRLQLDANAGEINRLRARIASLRVRTNYAVVAVSLQSTDASSAFPAAEEDGLGGALDDAGDSLSGALELLIRALGIAIPLALLAAVAGFGARAIRRRRRESALG